jgi:peptidyl-tRNA hydrolase, PTH1 family
MKVIVALGNPGSQYARTRHNVAWWLVEHLSAAWKLRRFHDFGVARVAETERVGEEVRIVCPQTYMNRSGAAVKPLREAEDFDVGRDLLVVVDDVSLPPGRIRFRPRGSAGGHNGLRSIEQVLGSREYGRLRIGVGAPPTGEDMADWVLSPPDPDEEEAIIERLPELAEALDCWIAEGIEPAMSRYNG